MSKHDTWEEWSQFVLNELKRLNGSQEAIRKEVGDTRIEIATLKVKAGIWGLAGGAMPVVVMILLNSIKS